MWQQSIVASNNAFASDSSLPSLESQTHGRIRRRQRGISKEQLQLVMKNGVREQIWKGEESRFKFTYRGICLITDHSCSIEITAWRLKNHDSSLGRLNLGRMMTQQMHFIIVIDSSRSMEKSDVGQRYRNRLHAVNQCIIRDLMQALHQTDAVERSLLSLIEMREMPYPMFVGQPGNDPRLWDYLMARAESESPSSQGNYLPALCAVGDILGRLEQHGSGRQVYLIFLSDGRPSDRGANSNTLQGACRNAIVQLSDIVQGRLHIATIAFGPRNEDYSVLEAMAGALPGRGTFHILGLRVDLLSSAMSSLVSGFSSWALGTLAGGRGLTLRDLPSLGGHQQPSSNSAFISTDRDEWQVYPMDEERPNSQTSWRAVIAYDRFQGRMVPTDMSSIDLDAQWVLGGSREFRQRYQVRGIAKQKASFAQGSERAVFRGSEVLSEVDGPWSIKIGPQLVIKETIYDAFLNDGEYHSRFLQILAQADRLSYQFNHRMSSMIGFTRPELTIKFLQPKVYYLQDPSYPRGVCEWLVEPQLEGEYRKWNDNRGRVIARDPPISHMGGIAEDEEWQEGGGEEEEDTQSVPQAFSHFSHFQSRENLLICDLQGTHNEIDGFTFTDPAIHSIAKSEGATDKGREGIAAFFASHVCGKWCHMLDLPPMRR